MTSTARLSADGSKIILSGTTPDELEFYHSLPYARWDRLGHVWTCKATPAAAWRIFCQPDSQCSIGLREFGEPFGLAARLMNPKNGCQPAVHKTDAWEHQQRAYGAAYTADAALLAMAMGTGKSKVAIDLVQNWDCKMVLILCPKSVIGVWRREFRRHAVDDWLLFSHSKGTVATKAVRAYKAMVQSRMMDQPFGLVVNYESAWRPDFAKFILGHRWDCIIADESHRIKSHGSSVSKFCAKLYDVSDHRLALTGTPLPHSPLDAFGQLRFLDPGITGTSFHWFRSHFARRDNPSIPMQVTSYQNQDELQARMSWVTYRVTDDVLDLPPSQHEDRVFELSPKAKKAYAELRDELITEVKEGVVTVANALVKLLRLQQVTSGYLTADDGDDAEQIDTGKRDQLRDILEDAGEPVVVFCRFKQDIQNVKEVAESLKLSYGELSGSRRDGLTADATMAEVDVLGAQIQSGGVGIDLTRARIGVYYSIGCISPGGFEQTVKRIDRPGQTRPIIFYRLIAEGTVDQTGYKALAEKGSIIEAILCELGKGV